MLLAWRIDVRGGEVVLNGRSCINVLEGCNISRTVVVHFEELPAQVDLDTALLALFKGNLVSIGEGIDELVGGPVLDLATLGRKIEKLILSVEPLVVEGVEVGALTLVGHSWRVADVVTDLMVIAVVIVAREAILAVDLVHEDLVAFMALIVFSQALNIIQRVVEAGADDEGLVGELLAVLKGELVSIWVELGDLGLLNLGPVVDHCLGILGVTLE